jgi:PA domain
MRAGTVKRLGAMAAVLALALLWAVPADAARCPRAVDAHAMASAKALRKLNAAEASFGARPTASDAQNRFISWLARKLKRIDGVKVRSLDYTINRWVSNSTALSAGGAAVQVAGPVPHSKPTGAGGITAPLVYLSAGEPITAANSAGKIVALEDPPTTYPYSVFFPGSLGVAGYTPIGLDPNAPYTRDSRTEATYLRQAQTAGAAGLIIVKDLPRSEISGFYRPYSGTNWTIPGAFVGADEGVALKQVATGAGQATLSVDASFGPAPTRTLLATLRGRGRRPAKFVVESHTDGMNAVWDNGPIAMIAMARYLSDLGRQCRPRTIEFAFTTGHLYGSIGSEDVAARLNSQYDSGRVAGALALEHMGAYEYATVPRSDGPGNHIVRTGDHELTLVSVTQSSALRAAVIAAVNRARLDRTAVLTGTDPPNPNRAPPNCAFGGEGTAYDRELVPAIGEISGPRELFTPGYGIETIDFPFMRRQTLAFTNLLLRLNRMSIRAISGDLIEMRRQRASGAPGCPETG